MDLAEWVPGTTQVRSSHSCGPANLGDASERSSSNSEIALRSHEYLDTLGGTRDIEGSRPDVSRAGSPLVLTLTSPDVSQFLTAFFHKLGVVCAGPDGGMILLCIRSNNGKKGSFNVKGQPYAS